MLSFLAVCLLELLDSTLVRDNNPYLNICINDESSFQDPLCLELLPSHFGHRNLLGSFGIERDVDFVAASFVRKAEDVDSIRHFIAETHDKFWPANHPKPLIISKIENLGVLCFSLAMARVLVSAAAALFIARKTLASVT